MDYLALLRRTDFVDLYKYGYFYLNKDKIVSFDCPVSELSKRSDIFDFLFSQVNSFESSFTYLLIHYTKSDIECESSFVSIEEVKGVYPLDSEAKREYESSFDEHIRIENPIWDDTISLIQKRLLFESSIQGARNVFTIFKLNEIERCKTIIDDDMVEEMLSDVYDNRRPKGNKSIWVYLMRYERHSFYPKDTLGFYMDVVHVICNFMAKREVEDYEVESTTIYNILDSYNGLSLKSNEIIERLNKDDRAAGFLYKLKEFVPEANFIKVAVNYLYMRYRYSDKFFYEEKIIESCKTSFADSFILASYMLGITLSHDNTYSCLYETLPLPIYKSKQEMDIIYKQRADESEKARKEMERLEFERKQEKTNKGGYFHKFGKKKKGRANYSNNPDQNNYYSHKMGEQSDSEYAPSSIEKETYMPPFREEFVQMDKQSISQKETKRIKNIESPSLFDDEEFNISDKDDNNPIAFPIKLRKYTPNGKPSNAKNAIKIVKSQKEYERLVNSKEIWKIVK